MKYAGEVRSTMCMKILGWCLYRSYSVGAQLRIMVSPVGWFLHNILLSWCSTEEIGVSSKLVPRNFLKVGWCHINL
jgi:uncharacterized protein YaaW (UPF0174 family)